MARYMSDATRANIRATLSATYKRKAMDNLCDCCYRKGAMGRNVPQGQYPAYYQVAVCRYCGFTRRILDGANRWTAGEARRQVIAQASAHRQTLTQREQDAAAAREEAIWQAHLADCDADDAARQ